MWGSHRNVGGQPFLFFFFFFNLTYVRESKVLHEGFTLENKELRNMGEDYRGEFVNPPVSKGAHPIGIILAYRRCTVYMDRDGRGRDFGHLEASKFTFVQRHLHLKTELPSLCLMQLQGMMTSAEDTRVNRGGCLWARCAQPRRLSVCLWPVTVYWVQGSVSCLSPVLPLFFAPLLTFVIPFTKGCFHLPLVVKRIWLKQSGSYPGSQSNGSNPRATVSNNSWGHNSCLLWKWRPLGVAR